MTTWPSGYVNDIGGEECTDCAAVDCSPWKVRVNTEDTHLCVDRNANFAYRDGQPVVIPVGTELWVNEADATWLSVTSVAVNGDGQPEYVGFVRPLRTEYVSGTPTADPYVITDGRDGSPDSAIAYAESCLAGGSRYVPGSYAKYIGSDPNGQDISTGYSERCLGFVSTCFGVPRCAMRCPEIANPGTYGYPGSAWGAFQALRDNLKIRYSKPIPRGAILFWNSTARNSYFGHIAIMADDAGNVISSGAPGRPLDPNEGPDVANYQYYAAGSHPDVFKDTLAVVSDWTDPDTGDVCGWTTPDVAFADGMWNGKACIEPEPEPETP